MPPDPRTHPAPPPSPPRTRRKTRCRPGHTPPAARTGRLRPAAAQQGEQGQQVGEMGERQHPCLAEPAQQQGGQEGSGHAHPGHRHHQPGVLLGRQAERGHQDEGRDAHIDQDGGHAGAGQQGAQHEGGRAQQGQRRCPRRLAGRVSLSSRRLTRALMAATSAMPTKMPRHSKCDRMR